LAIGHAAAMCEAIEGLACVAAKQSEAARAAELLALADTHRARRSLPRRHDDAECISRLYIELGDQARASAASTTQSRLSHESRLSHPRLGLRATMGHGRERAWRGSRAAVFDVAVGDRLVA
jgi:hypothetical protein